LLKITKAGGKIMASHKFTYTISGVELSEEHQAAISREIASAVTRALIGVSPSKLKTDFLTVTKIRGGIWIDPALAGRESVGELVARAEG
jgi:hypothetical protein